MELRPLVKQGLTSPCGVPGDVWHLVFRWLELPEVCKFGVCCRSAATLAFSCEAAWSLVRLPRKCKHAALSILKLGASLGNPLCKHFDATSAPFLEDETLAGAVPWIPLLERINLNGCRRVHSAILAVARSCAALSAIQCAGCPRLSDSEIVGVCQQAGTRLVTLDLSGCSSRIGDDSARALGQFCTALRELRLAGCKKLSDAGVTFMLAGMDDCKQGAYGVGRGSLTSLELSSCERLTDVALEPLCSRCSSLKHLDLSISDNFSSHMLSRVLMASCRLKTLDLVGVRGMTDDVLNFLPTTLESIALAACHISDPGVQALSRRCPRTHSLDLAANSQITDAGFCALADLASLRSLNLNYTSISDEALQVFADAKMCQVWGAAAQGQQDSPGGLSHPRDFACGGVASGGAGVPARGGSRRVVGGSSDLLVLNLRGCRNVTEHGVACLSDIGRCLVHLDVRETRVIRLAGATPPPNTHKHMLLLSLFLSLSVCLCPSVCLSVCLCVVCLSL